MEPLRTEITDLLRQVNRHMHDRFRLAFRQVHFPPHAFFMLRQLLMNPGATVSELSRQLDIAKSHISKTIDMLARQGYVEKRPDESDQRLVRLYATKEATDQVALCEATIQTAWNGIVEGVPPAQLRAVVDGMRILLTALEQPTADGRTPPDA